MHQVVLVHEFSECFVATGDKEDLKLSYRPLRQLQPAVISFQLLAFLYLNFGLTLWWFWVFFSKRFGSCEPRVPVSNRLNKRYLNSIYLLMNSCAVLTQKYSMVNTHIDLLKHCQVEYSIPHVAVPCSLFLSAEWLATICAVVVLRSFQIFKQKLAKYFFLQS